MGTGRFVAWLLVSLTSAFLFALGACADGSVRDEGGGDSDSDSDSDTDTDSDADTDSDSDTDSDTDSDGDTDTDTDTGDDPSCGAHTQPCCQTGDACDTTDIVCVNSTALPEDTCFNSCTPPACTTAEGYQGICWPAGTTGVCNGIAVGNYPTDCEATQTCTTGTCYTYTEGTTTKYGCFVTCTDFQVTCAAGEYCPPLTSGGGVCMTYS